MITADDTDSDVDESARESDLEAIHSGKAPSKPARPKKKVTPVMAIEQMAAECMKDSHEEEDDDDDESLLRDPELLKELQTLSVDCPSEGNFTVTLPEEEDEPEENDSKASLKTSENVIYLIEQRLQLYSNMLAASKAVGDTSKVQRFNSAIKTLEGLLICSKLDKAIKEGKIPPLDGIPNAPRASPELEHEDPAMFAAPPPPASILEALGQRFEKHTSTKAAAEAEGNGSKVRRLQRIKPYEDPIKYFTAGKHVDFEELRIPLGYARIPISSQKSVPPATVSEKNTPKPEDKCKPDVKPTVPLKRPAPQVPQPRNADAQPQKRKIRRINDWAYKKQVDFLFKCQAELDAKKSDDIPQAEHYLRMSKGFDSMIEATKCGLPVAAPTIPIALPLLPSYSIVNVSRCVENANVDSTDLLETLENDLMKQIEVCIQENKHFLELGDVSSASKFEEMGLKSRKDLSVIRHLKKTGGSAPRFRYETRVFFVIRCNAELCDNDLEVTIERGINLPGNQNELDSYVIIELPVPNDSPQKAKTHTIRGTNNPIFQEEFKFEINRKSRAQLRQFKRQSLKLEVWSKGGFLRSDVLLGTVSVKLIDLESKCTIHDCFDLMEGRKTCGGKLEVKVRIRDPLLVKQVEEVKEKWLVIES